MEVNQLLIAQVPLLLLGIGYFIKRVYDLKSKKVEIKYSLFHNRKIEAITRFIKNFSSAERMWQGFYFKPLYERTYSTTELDKIIWTTISQLDISLHELTLYLTDDEKRPFEEIVEHLNKINKTASDIFFQHIRGDYIEVSNQFYDVKSKSIDKCKSKLREIGTITRLEYTK